MRLRIAAGLLVLTLGAQEVPIAETPKPAPKQTLKPPAKPSARKPKAAKPTPAPEPPPLPEPPVEVVEAPVPAAEPAPEPAPDPTAEALAKLPPVYGFPAQCLATTRFLQEAGRVNPWRATLTPFEPAGLERQVLLARTRLAEGVLPLCRCYRLSGNNLFGGNRSEFNPNLVILSGPGFILGTLKQEVSRGVRVRFGDDFFLQFTFSEFVVELWPDGTARNASGSWALAFQHGRIQAERKGRTRFPVPFSTAGTLALRIQEHEATGLFRFPLGNGVIPVKGIRLRNEFWLEATRPARISMLYFAGDPAQTPGICQAEPPRTLRIKVRLEKPQRIELSFLPAGPEQQFRFSSPLAQESALSVVAEEPDLAPLVELAGQHRSGAQRPGWHLDPAEDGFPALGDRAFIRTGFEVPLWDCSLPKANPEAGFAEWRREHADQVGRALRLKAKLVQAPAPPE